MDAKNKMADIMARLGKSPRGVGLGMQLLIGAGGLVYGISQSMYTGKTETILSCACTVSFLQSLVLLVEGGQRAIIFSRIGGVQNEVYAEGLHFRYG